MASKCRVELNLKGLNELMKSSAMTEILEERGAEVANIASDMGIAGRGKGSYRSAAIHGNWINAVNIWPADEDAARDSYENNTLIKALGSSGLPLKKE